MLRQASDPVLLVDTELKSPAWNEFIPQARAVNPATRVVLLTPTRSARLELQARSLGVTALVRRPFAIQELLNAVGPSGDTEVPPGAPPEAPAPPAPPSPTADP